jgi:hypothetical protein
LQGVGAAQMVTVKVRQPIVAAHRVAGDAGGNRLPGCAKAARMLTSKTSKPPANRLATGKHRWHGVEHRPPQTLKTTP